MTTLRACLLALSLLLGLAGATAAGPRPPHVNLIGLIGDRAILRVDGEQVLLRRGESRDGLTLVAIEAGQAVLRLEGRELRLGLGMDTGGIAPREGGGSVELVMNDRGQFVTNGMINGRVVDFLVDTGANTVSMTTQDADRLGIDYRLAGTPARSATAGGVVRAWGVTLKSVQIGPLTVKNVQASVREAPRNAPILLGMTFLSQVSLRQDGHKLRLSAR